MKINYPYLSDTQFLSIIDSLTIREQIVKLTLLSWDEEPLQDIEGIVISGNLTIDGSSSMRRTANLSILVSDKTTNYDDLNNIFNLNKKVYLQIGIVNKTDYYVDYPIIWFPQGLFVIDSISLSHNTGGSSLSVNLKDKMCLLNGQCGGTLPASVSFHEVEEEQEDGSITITSPTIYEIIRELVNHYGGESLNKIIIQNIDQEVKQVVKWIGIDAVYYITTPVTDSETPTAAGYFSLTRPDNVKAENITTFDYGEDVGYIYTAFTYPGELIGSAGQSVCDILDSIKNTLGNFEYFYDINGNFIFREIRNYLNTTQATYDLDKIKNGEAYLIDPSNGKVAYSFENSNIITSYSNSPQLANIKNDFIIWGKRTSIDGTQLPIRYHLTIDSKPEINTNELIKVKAILEEDKKTVKEILPLNSSKPGSVIVTIDKDQARYDWICELYFSGLLSENTGIDYNNYYIELMNEWIKLYTMTVTTEGEGYIGTIDINDKVKYESESLDYFLDIIDSNSKIQQLSIKNIGKRTKVLVDDKINCIFEPEVLNVIILEAGSPDIEKLREKYGDRGESWTQVPAEIYSKMVIGGTLNSALVAMRDLLYQYTHYNESIQLNTLPIYYLEPNTRISVKDEKSNIFGDYLINSISVSLNGNDQMSISANKILTKF